MAGFFGFFDYSRPGPGVPKDAPPKSRFIVFFEVYLRKFWKLVTLNIIYAIACLPLLAGALLALFMQNNAGIQEMFFIFIVAYAVNIFTLGPATAGFTYVLRNYAREEHAWVWSDFKEHALKNYKQAVLISVIDLVVLIIAYVNFQFYSQAAKNNMFYGYLKYVVILMGFIYLIMHMYIYPILVTFKLSVKQIFKNAFIFAIVKLPQNIGIMLICGVVLFAFYYYYIVGMLLTPFIVISTLGLIMNFYTYTVIKKYMIDHLEEPENIEEEKENHTEI